MISKGMGSYLYGTKPAQMPEEAKEPQVAALTSENLTKLEKNPYQQPESIQVDSLNYDELNQLLHRITTTLVLDKAKLSKWIAGT